MKYIIPTILLTTAIVAVGVIMKGVFLKKYSTEKRKDFIIVMLTIPMTLFGIRLESDFHLLENVHFLLKGIIYGLCILVINFIIYSLIKKVVTG